VHNQRATVSKTGILVFGKKLLPKKGLGRATFGHADVPKTGILVFGKKLLPFSGLLYKMA